MLRLYIFVELEIQPIMWIENITKHKYIFEFYKSMKYDRPSNAQFLQIWASIAFQKI